jgi:hypothetical protein
VGDDGEGGSYSFEFGPDGPSLGDRLAGRGKYESTPMGIPACERAKTEGKCVAVRYAPPATDKILNKVANAMDGNKDDNFNCVFYNCISAVDRFDAAARSINPHSLYDPSAYPSGTVNLNTPSLRLP